MNKLNNETKNVLIAIAALVAFTLANVLYNYIGIMGFVIGLILLCAIGISANKTFAGKFNIIWVIVGTIVAIAIIFGSLVLLS